MDITISVTASEFSQEDQLLIQQSLNLTPIQLDAALVKLCKSSFMEYLKMFKEKGVPSRAEEVQQERLYFLLSHYFQDRLPTEGEISSIFQLTSSQSKTLLRNTKSRYRTKIRVYLKNTLLKTLQGATQPNDENYEFVCHSQNVIEELNLIISQKGPELRTIEKIRGLSSKYLCSEDTYTLLMEELQ